MKNCHFAHNYWKKILCPGSIAIDATVGNGHDTMVLAQILQGTGKIYGYDIQENALQNANFLFNSQLSERERSNIELSLRSHETFSVTEADLIIYNLGYLPGGNKEITTRTESTLKSLSAACAIVKKAISVMCYLGHEEGYREFEKVFSFFQSLPSKDFLVCHHTWINRNKAPTLFWCEKIHHCSQ